jgi:hypothetical protein
MKAVIIDTIAFDGNAELSCIAYLVKQLQRNSPDCLFICSFVCLLVSYDIAF